MRSGMLSHTRAILWVFCLLGLIGGCAKDRFRHVDPELYYEAAQKALLKKKCWDAQQLLQNMLSDFPGSHLVDDAQFLLAKAYLCDKDYVTAVFEYERLLNEFPTSPFVDKARYQIGMCYYQQSRDVHHDQEETHRAIREFRRFAEDFPASDLSADSLERVKELRGKLARQNLMIAENYLKWSLPLSAERYCTLILSEFSDTDVMDEARFMLARAKRKMAQIDEAREILTLLASDGISDSLREKVKAESEALQKEASERAPKPVPDGDE